MAFSFHRGGHCHLIRLVKNPICKRGRCLQRALNMQPLSMGKTRRSLRPKWIGSKQIQNRLSCLTYSLFIRLDFPVMNVAATATAQAEEGRWECGKYRRHPNWRTRCEAPVFGRGVRGLCLRSRPVPRSEARRLIPPAFPRWLPSRRPKGRPGGLAACDCAPYPPRRLSLWRSGGRSWRHRAGEGGLPLRLQARPRPPRLRHAGAASRSPSAGPASGGRAAARRAPSPPAGGSAAAPCQQRRPSAPRRRSSGGCRDVSRVAWRPRDARGSRREARLAIVPRRRRRRLPGEGGGRRCRHCACGAGMEP